METASAFLIRRRDQVRRLLLNNPLVNAFCVGTGAQRRDLLCPRLPARQSVIYVGAKTGRDGIHGATMASEDSARAQKRNRPNVKWAIRS